jgi:hypothetical protein
LFSNGSAKIFSKHAQVRGAGAFQMSLRIMCRAYSVDTWSVPMMLGQYGNPGSLRLLEDLRQILRLINGVMKLLLRAPVMLFAVLAVHM